MVPDAYVSTAVILIGTYIATLVRNRTGANFRFINLLVGILLANHVCLLAFAYADFQIFLRSNEKPWIVWDLALAGGLIDLGFCTAHCLLAFKYRQIARDGPLVLEGKVLPEGERSRERRLTICLLSLNALFPFAEIIVGTIFYRQLFIESK